MMKMARFDDFPDDDFIETERQKKKPKKSSEDEFQELLYNKRCHLVKLSKTSEFAKFMEFLRENEHIFAKMNDADKECMRRTCQRALDSSYASTIDDIQYCNKMFGPYIDVRRSKRVPVFGKKEEHQEPKMTLEEEIAYRSRGSYYAMWDFITNPEFQDKLKGRTDLYDKVKYMIDRAKTNNEAILPQFKTYEPLDEEMYVKILELMKE